SNSRGSINATISMLTKILVGTAPVFPRAYGEGNKIPDHSPSSEFPSPSAQPSARFPDLLLAALRFDGISTHQIYSRRASDTIRESYRAWPLPPRPPAPFEPAGERSRPVSPFLLPKAATDPGSGARDKRGFCFLALISKHI